MNQEEILKKYYSKDGKVLHEVVDKILRKFGNIPDKSEFYSLANEVFVDVLGRYDGTRDFNGFLYSCLENKIKTYFTMLNRKKRISDRTAISMETPLEEDSEATIRDLIEGNVDFSSVATGNVNAVKFDIMDSVSADVCEMIVSRIETESILEKYYESLSKLQRKIVALLAADYKPMDIRKILHISKKKYADNIKAIQSYESIEILIGRKAKKCQTDREDKFIR